MLDRPADRARARRWLRFHGPTMPACPLRLTAVSTPRTRSPAGSAAARTARPTMSLTRT